MMRQYTNALSPAGLVRSQAPIIHCITNYVTARDVANVLLAVGASPIMADHPEEAAEITGLSNALLLNLGTLKETSLTAMLRAGSEAARRGLPILLDPVGAGASCLRTETALTLLKRLPITLIRGNVSELKALLREPGTPRGVDAAFEDTAFVDAAFENAAFENAAFENAAFENAAFVDAAHIETAVRLSRLTQSVIIMTGQTDIASDGRQTALIRNGCPEMARITGAGCMLDALITAYAAVCGDPFEAAVSATAASGICGEQAKARMLEADRGLGSFGVFFLDAVSRINDKLLEGEAKIDIQ